MQDFSALAQEVSPAYAFTYYAHAAIGFGAAALGVVALASRKGGPWHRRSGQIFLAALGFASLSALYFVVARVPAPPVLISALAAIYAMGMAILSLQKRKGGWFALQAVLIALPVFNGLLYLAFAPLAFTIPEIPTYVGVLGPLAGVFYLTLAWKDVQFLRASSVETPRRLRRHGFRMAVVCAEVVRAPLQSFGPPFLGEEHSFQFYAFAPMVLIPLFYFAARPDWLKPAQPAPAAM